MNVQSIVKILGKQTQADCFRLVAQGGRLAEAAQEALDHWQDYRNAIDHKRNRREREAFNWGQMRHG